MLEYRFVVARMIGPIQAQVNELAAVGWTLHSFVTDNSNFSAVMVREKPAEKKPFPRPSVPEDTHVAFPED